MNDATSNMVRIIKGSTVRVYTITKGLPVATRWTEQDGDQVLALDAAREELASLLTPGSGWSMLPSAL
jgi:predicted transcriptional regulator